MKCHVCKSELCELTGCPICNRSPFPERTLKDVFGAGIDANNLLMQDEMLTRYKKLISEIESEMKIHMDILLGSNNTFETEHYIISREKKTIHYKAQPAKYGRSVERTIVKIEKKQI